MSSDAETRADLKEMRDKLDQILAGTVRTNTILDQVILPEMKEMRSKVASHENLRQRAIGLVLTLGIGGGALGGKVAHALGWLGGSNKS